MKTPALQAGRPSQAVGAVMLVPKRVTTRSACNKTRFKGPETYCARYVSTSWKEGERSGGDSVRDWVMVAGVVSRGL